VTSSGKSQSVEQELALRLQEHHSRRKAFEQLVAQYSEQLYWMIRRMVLSHDDANDVLQNTFLKAWNGLDAFHGDARLSTWLTRIAINESLDFLRRNNHPTVSTEDESSISLTLQADPYFDGSEVEAMLQEAIATLPDVQRSVFLMRYYDEMKYSEISQILNTSEGALKASYHIAVKKIADFFKARD
jgi:RNA polymerase sigma-70 factor (ECF subfamily)